MQQWNKNNASTWKNGTILAPKFFGSCSCIPSSHRIPCSHGNSFRTPFTVFWGFHAWGALEGLDTFLIRGPSAKPCSSIEKPWMWVEELVLNQNPLKTYSASAAEIDLNFGLTWFDTILWHLVTQLPVRHYQALSNRMFLPPSSLTGKPVTALAMGDDVLPHLLKSLGFLGDYAVPTSGPTSIRNRNNSIPANKLLIHFIPKTQWKS